MIYNAPWFVVIWLNFQLMETTVLGGTTSSVDGCDVGDKAPTWIEGLDNQTNDIAKGEVSTGWDKHTVCVCTYLCCG